MLFLEENLSGVPFTRTGFLTSKYCSPLVSGLHVEITSAAYDDDEKKVSDFIDSSNFNFFELCATKYGFLIDKNVPWRIVANVGSTEMESYMKSYGTDSISLFNDYYELSYLEDIDIFVKYCIRLYKRFIASRPKIKKTVGEGKNKKVFFEKRPDVSYDDYAPETKEKYWVEKYTKLRNIECQDRYTGRFIANLLSNFEGFLRQGKYQEGLAYVNRCFIGFLNDNGGYNSYNYIKTMTSEGEKISRQELEEVLSNSIPLSRDTIY